MELLPVSPSAGLDRSEVQRAAYLTGAEAVRLAERARRADISSCRNEYPDTPTSVRPPLAQLNAKPVRKSFVRSGLDTRQGITP